MGSWSVTLTYPSPADEHQLTAWSDALGDDVTVAAVPGNATTVALWVDAPDPVEAAAAAVGVTGPVIPHEPTAIGVVDEDSHLTAAHAPTVPDLVSSVEAGELLGVSRQRVGQLAKDHPQFPAPLYELRTGPLWTRQAIVWFDTHADRRPGRRRQLAG